VGATVAELFGIYDWTIGCLSFPDVGTTKFFGRDVGELRFLS
jgi:hypothetical protein